MIIRLRPDFQQNQKHVLSLNLKQEGQLKAHVIRMIPYCVLNTVQVDRSSDRTVERCFWWLVTSLVLRDSSPGLLLVNSEVGLWA